MSRLHVGRPTTVGDVQARGPLEGRNASADKSRPCCRGLQRGTRPMMCAFGRPSERFDPLSRASGLVRSSVASPSVALTSTGCAAGHKTRTPTMRHSRSLSYAFCASRAEMVSIVNHLFERPGKAGHGPLSPRTHGRITESAIRSGADSSTTVIEASPGSIPRSGTQSKQWLTEQRVTSAGRIDRWLHRFARGVARRLAMDIELDADLEFDPDDMTVSIAGLVDGNRGPEWVFDLSEFVGVSISHA